MSRCIFINEETDTLSRVHREQNITEDNEHSPMGKHRHVPFMYGHDIAKINHTQTLKHTNISLHQTHTHTHTHSTRQYTHCTCRHTHTGHEHTNTHDTHTHVFTHTHSTITSTHTLHSWYVYTHHSPESPLSSLDTPYIHIGFPIPVGNHRGRSSISQGITILPSLSTKKK